MRALVRAGAGGERRAGRAGPLGPTSSTQRALGPIPSGRRTRSVLVISAAPDDRQSTRSLRDIVAELRRRNLRLSLWFVRAPAPMQRWDGARVVDSLRAWGPALFLDRIGAPRAAFRLRGLRRHLWLLAARPDVVIFDDGVGDNLVKRLRHPHVRVVRANELAPFDVPLDMATPVGDVDLTLVGPGTQRVPGSQALDAPLIRDWQALFHDDPGAVRAQSRTRIGVDQDAIVIVGMGRDGWLDGPELFLRGLWTIEHRHGVRPVGVWLAAGADANEIERLEEESLRCGLRDRMTFLTDAGPGVLLCGDVALLPYRATGDVFDALGLIGAGLPVVTFPVWNFEHSLLRTVPHLDLEAAADAVMQALEGGFAKRRSDDPEPLETVPAWVDRMLDAIESCRT